MDSGFEKRRQRLSWNGPAVSRARPAPRRPVVTMLVGVVVGTLGAMLVIYTNQNYVASDAFMPYIVASAGYMLLVAASLLIGLVLLLFGRRTILWFFLSQVPGWAIGALAIRFAGGVAG